jgi:tetratricopeptide (TPR) repeat protein
MMKMSRVAALTTAALLLVSLGFTACSKEKEPSATKSKGAAINPYSSESVYTELKKKLDKDPNDVDALYHLADLYDRNAQYTEAVETYGKVVKLKPTMGYAYLKMGTAYDRLNKPAEAVAAFKKAEKYMPKYPVLFNNMGVAYGKLNKLDEEIAALKKAIKLRPTYTSAHFNLGITYLKLRNKKEAMKQYEALMQFDEGAAKVLLKEIDKAS